MSLLRIPFALSAALAVYITITPPIPPPKKDEKVPLNGSGSLPWGRKISKVLYCVLHLVEAAVVVASAVPSLSSSSWVISTFVLGGHPELSASRIRITPIFLLGWLLAVSSGIIRLSCYRTLGRLFTFELTIRKEHKLITSGPYSVVRHPSYTGFLMNIVGYNLCHLSSGSWLWECSGLWSSGIVGPVLMFVWLASRAYLVSMFIERTKTEDDTLRKEFSDWDEWARNVPYKLVPFVY